MPDYKMKFLPSYCMMSFRDSAEKTHDDAWREGVEYAMKNRDSIRMPNKDRIFEAAIIHTMLKTKK